MSGLDEQDEDKTFYSYKDLPPPPDLIKAKVWLKYRQQMVERLKRMLYWRL